MPRDCPVVVCSQRRCMPSLAPRELAACVCGFSTMSYQPDPEWLEAFAAQCKVLASDFTYQVSNTIPLPH